MCYEFHMKHNILFRIGLYENHTLISYICIEYSYVIVYYKNIIYSPPTPKFIPKFYSLDFYQPLFILVSLLVIYPYTRALPFNYSMGILL